MKRIRPFGDFREVIDDMISDRVTPEDINAVAKAAFIEEVSQVYARVIWNQRVHPADVSQLQSLGIPALSIALKLVDCDKFIEKVTEWCHQNNM